MSYEKTSLNGRWNMGYSEEEYTSSVFPEFCATPIDGAVPAYFEDLTDKFRNAPFFDKLRINPEYKNYEYPMSDYPPDMVLPNYVGNFFYEKEFELSELRDAELYFEGVQNAASVWLNSRFLVRREGYSTPFSVKIPKDLMMIGKNTLTLSVSNHTLFGFGGQPVSGITSRAASLYSGGVTGDVELRLFKGPLRSLSILVSEDLENVFVTVNATEECDVEWKIFDGKTLVKQGKSKQKFAFDTKNLEFWSPESPKLYKLLISVGEDFLERRFGIRRLLPDGAHFRLNGEPYYLRGICEHCYYPLTVHPTRDKAFYVNVISKLKELGFNFIRLHTHIPPKEYFEAADELGMLFQAECPNNTTLEEWRDIVDFCCNYTSVVIYCCGNELQIDDLRAEHLRASAEVVHSKTDGLFSPMSAMRGVEYGIIEEKQVVFTPFRHNPKRFAYLSEFSDLYNSFSNEHFSYKSTDADPKLISDQHSVYGKPRVTHEICIDGCFADLSLEKRYENTRIGKTALFSSVRRHLTEKGVIDKAELYFKNSSEWQRRLRKYCFEAVRRCENMAGYDFLGPIDTHWHTFGYDVGMMNEFYELKPGETAENVLRYNSPTVLLCDLGKRRNYASGDSLKCNIYASCYGITDGSADVLITLKAGDELVYEDIRRVRLENGRLLNLAELDIQLPETQKPLEIKLSSKLLRGESICENEWELYLFPKAENTGAENTFTSMTEEALLHAIDEGRDVVLFGSLPFKSLPTSFRMSLAGRTSGFTATVVSDHPILSDFPHDGFCGWQFSSMFEGGEAVVFPDDVPFDPIIEVVTTHKNFVRESALFEIECERSRIIVCSLNLNESDPAASWLMNKILSYCSKKRDITKLTREQLIRLMRVEVDKPEANTNLAQNKNDITAK